MKRAGIALLALGLISLAASVPASAGTLYDNSTSTSNTFNGISIGFGDFTTDSFSVASDSTAAGISFLVWVDPGATLSSVSWSIESSAPNIADDGSQTTATPTSTFIGNNIDGFDVYQETIFFSGISLTGGSTYYLTLQDAVTSNQDDAYWDESDGGSAASVDGSTLSNYYGTGTSGSETFQVLTPEPNSLVLLGTGLMLMAVAVARKVRA